MKEFKSLKYDIECYFRKFFPDKRIDMNFSINFIDVLIGPIVRESFDTIEFFCIKDVNGDGFWKV